MLHQVCCEQKFLGMWSLTKH